MLRLKNPTALVLLMAGLANAHLTGGTLVPKGGETLKAGQIVSVTWLVEEPHGIGIDIAFSKDDGRTWSNVKTGFNDNSKNDTFKWTVPNDAATTKGRLRICQNGPCTDADNVSKPGGDAPYVLVSGAFTVQAAAGTVAAPSAPGPFSVDFHPGTRNVDVSFGLQGSEAVLLQAYDTKGRLVATLLQGNFAAGAHSLSVSSHRLDANSGSLIFKLKTGDRVQTRNWMSTR